MATHFLVFQWAGWHPRGCHPALSLSGDMESAQFIAAVAAAVAVSAAVTDVRQRKIPNVLTYPAMLAGVVVQGIVYGWNGILLSIGGGLLFGGGFFFFF